MLKEPAFDNHMTYGNEPDNDFEEAFGQCQVCKCAAPRHSMIDAVSIDTLFCADHLKDMTPVQILEAVAEKKLEADEIEHGMKELNKYLKAWK